MTKQILIVDDDIGIRKITQITLQTIAGWDVLAAPSGQEGLAIAESVQPDVILLDMMMPGMDGLTTLKHLKSNPKTQAIPVIFLTAKVQISEQPEFSSLPILGIITKPFKAPDLVEQMRSLLNWHD